jgi:hypothetical protein
MVVRITIDKGIPLPPQRLGSRSGPKRRWPFLAMEPYDSFLIRTATPEREGRLAYSAAKRVGVRIAIRLQEGGIRVWRLPAQHIP